MGVSCLVEAHLFCWPEAASNRDGSCPDQDDADQVPPAPTGAHRPPQRGAARPQKKNSFADKLQRHLKETRPQEQGWQTWPLVAAIAAVVAFLLGQASRCDQQNRAEGLDDSATLPKFGQWCCSCTWPEPSAWTCWCGHDACIRCGSWWGNEWCCPHCDSWEDAGESPPDSARMAALRAQQANQVRRGLGEWAAWRAALLEQEPGLRPRGHSKCRLPTVTASENRSPHSSHHSEDVWDAALVMYENCHCKGRGRVTAPLKRQAAHLTPGLDRHLTTVHEDGIAEH